MKIYERLSSDIEDTISHNTLVLPVLLFGGETWTTKASDARRITAAEMKYEVCPEYSRIYRVKIFQSYLEAIQPCRLQSSPLYSVCT